MQICQYFHRIWDDADEIEVSPDGKPGAGQREDKDAEVVEDRHEGAVERHGGAEPMPARRDCAGAAPSRVRLRRGHLAASMAL